jgi:hypothetical protein
MNIEQAKAIPIAYILDLLNQKPIRKTNRETWYLSPLREEKNASFKIHHQKNVWYDFGLGIGGDGIDLVRSWLESQKHPHSVSDALQWLRNTVDDSVIKPAQFIRNPENENNNSKLVIKSVRNLKHKALEHYLNERGIPITIADRFLKEVRVHNTETDKNFFALGLQNEESGYELRNVFFKGCVGTKHITFIRGSEAKPQGIHVFEGFMDYLSILAQQEGRPFKEDTIILNSLSCIKLALPYINNYGYTVAYTWMDNDSAGEKAKQTLDDFFKTQEGLIHKPMNRQYNHHKDVNAWHMHTLGF